MTVEDRDPLTGELTTGHEWNGIKELNTAVPMPVWVALLTMTGIAVVMWILYPAWPLGRSFTPGLLGIDQHRQVDAELAEAMRQRSGWRQEIADRSVEEIEADPTLRGIIQATGHRMFGDACAACHGADARGNRGFPNLTTQSWLWGGDPDTIAETLRVGINSTHPESRTSQMPSFGKDGILQRADIEKVVAYVTSLSATDAVAKADPAVETGAKVFAENCAACHGEDGRGSTDVGAPNLTDAFWIYGGDKGTVFQTVWGGRQGHMPTWESRFGPVDRKILALYLLQMREPAP